MATVISYNLNGIRAAFRKGFGVWLEETQPDVLCIQETKAQESQIDKMFFQSLGYHQYWFSAKKKGYSGVGILTKTKPTHVEVGMGIPEYDDEGRFIRADFGDISVVSVYHPSGSSGDTRQEFKMKWLDDYRNYIAELQKERPNLILSGDYNICNKPIDIHDPVRNKKTSGFLPEERAWFDEFIGDGFIDSFRHFNKEPHHYSWWSYRANARANNKGWRLDYHLVTESLRQKLTSASILPNVKHSDHCPIVLDVNF